VHREDERAERRPQRADALGIARARVGEEPPRHEVEEGGDHPVKDERGEVIADGVHAPQAPVERQGEPRERHPVAHEPGRQHPGKLRRAEAAVVRVVEEVLPVVPVQEVAAEPGQEREHARQRDGEG
jgi:hypothetical protein